MTKIVHLTHDYECEHLLGKFLDHDSYDLLINEDMDVYKPLEIADAGEYGENNLLLKFRKGVFSQKMSRETYDALETGATMTDNRGLAAGVEREAIQKMPSGKGTRRWVTQQQKAILDYFASGSPTAGKFSDNPGADQLDAIIARVPDKPMTGRGTGGVSLADMGISSPKNIAIKAGATWLSETPKTFVFSEWVLQQRHNTPEQRMQHAIDLAKLYITDTTYANGALSGVAGSMDRYPRIPFCRQTGWTAANPEKYNAAMPLLEAASEVFRENVPIRWKGQKDYVQNIDKQFMVGNTVYTTITINKSFRTACHRDAGDLCDPGVSGRNPRGFSNLIVVSNGKQFDGFYLCFPEYRAAVNVQPGDMIMMDAHCIHGNVPLVSCEEGFERLSLVLYVRERMAECEPHKMEETRKNFVYARRLNPDHPLWHDGWNGISPGCFMTEDWANYLRMNGFPEEAEKVIPKQATLF